MAMEEEGGGWMDGWKGVEQNSMVTSSGMIGTRLAGSPGD